ncbi:MAG: RnfABCDGE type electron transport complex subunit G [Bacteroidota bacterium]
MAKLDSSLKNMILSLLFISMGMSAALGFVYNLTKDPIAAANKAKEVNAVKDVLPPFNNDPTTEVKNIENLAFYPATMDGKPIGCAVKTYTEKGYSGRFDLMVGFLPDGKINNIVVLEQKETPGLGTKMKEPKFRNQFNALDIGSLQNKEVKVKKDGGSIDAISAATISSRAFCDGVQKAYNLYMKNFAPDSPVVNDTTMTKGGIK